jgi:DNA-binding GntR family transcriptional regulator
MRESRHREITELLLKDIASDRYQVGSVLPSEAELQEQFGVGRHTIREALRTLKDQGVLERRRRLGSIVRAQHLVGKYVNLLLDERGLRDFVGHTDFTLTNEGYVHLSSSLAASMEAEPGSRWLRLAGTRTLKDDDGFLCWSEIFLPAHLAIDRAAIRAPGMPIYEKVLKTNMLKLGHVEQEISATSLPASLGKAIGSEPNQPALMVKRRYFATDGAVVEVSFNMYPADRYLARSIIRPMSR